MGLWSSIVAIAGVVAAPFTGGASLFLTAAAVVAPKVVDSVVDFVMKPLMGLMGVPAVGAAAEASFQQGVVGQKTGSIANVPVVYGYRKVGDIVTFSETGATDNKYLWVAHVYCEGEIAGLAKLFCDDNELPADVITRLNQGKIVDVDSGKYSGRMRLQFFTGAYHLDPSLGSNPVRQFCFFNTDSDRPPNWTNDMVYNGLAVLFARYEWKKINTQADADANPYSSGIPKMSAELFGKKVSPVPATAPANEYDADTVRYNVITTGSSHTIGYINPVEALLDYMRNPRYGKGLKNADIDWASWNAAANKCATEVTYVSGIKGPIMNFNYVVDTSQTLFNNIKTMMTNFRGYMPYVQGKYKLKIEDAGHPTDILSGSADIVATFNRDNIVGDIVYTGIERSSKYNQVVVTWIDPDNKWSNQEVIFPETESDRQYFIDQDGGRENKGTFTAGGITNQIMAKDLARIIFYKNRLQDSISLTVSSQGIEIEPGDNIHIHGNVLWMNDTYPYRVISTQLNSDMSVTLGCVYNPDVIYPYVRWGEPDRVLPVYVPKGAERYYPAITASEKNGLIPPYVNKFIGSNVVTRMSDVINITQISFVSLGTATVGSSENIYADIKFNQPNTSFYASTIFYWKEDVASATTWAQYESTVTPGANQEITVRLGPVVYGKNYIINTRVTYQSGQVSSKMGAYNFTVSTAAVTPTPTAGTAAALAASTPLPNPADDIIWSITSATVTSGGLPTTPRKISVSAQFHTTKTTLPPISGIESFWKPSGNSKWYYQFNAIDAIKADYTATFNIELGIPVYPLVPGSSAPAKVDDYDFIFRWKYSDGKTSLYQLHATNVSVEYNGLGYAFDPFTTTAAANVNNKESTSAYTPVLMTVNDIVDTRNITVSVYAVKDNTGPKTRLFLNPPVASDIGNWHGVRVYRHKSGTTNTWDYEDFSTVDFNASSVEWSVAVTSTYNDMYEYVVVPFVVYGDTIVEGLKGQYLAGYVASLNQTQTTNFRIDAVEDLTTAKAKIGTTAALPPDKTTKLDQASAITVLTSSLPSVPRKLSFTVKQRSAAFLNGHIAGFVVYYKQSDSTYWKKSKYAVSGYTESSYPTVTFDSTQTTPVMDLGYPSYPTFPGREQYYDFIIRFYYDDGSESQFESVFNGKIENEGSSGSPDFNITLSAVSDGVWLNRVATVPVTEDLAPPGAVFDIRDIMKSTSFVAQQLFVPANSRSANFFFSTPIAALKSYLAGFRILMRPIVAGTNPDFTTNDSNMPYLTATTYVNNAYVDCVYANQPGIVYHQDYEFAVIPMVWYQGAKTEANQCLYWRGRLTDSASAIGSDPYTDNFYGRSTPQVVDTAGIRNTLHTTFPNDNPTVKMQSITPVKTDVTNNLGYYSITYQVPSSFVSATIYRRVVYDYNGFKSSQKGYYYNASDFRGAGKWEKITVNNTTYPLTTLADGTKTQTVNLRPAVYNEFNTTMIPSLPKYVGSSLDSQTLYKNYTNTAPTILELASDANQQNCITQLFIVINYTNNSGTSTLSTNGLRVDLYNYRMISGIQTWNAAGVPLTDCTIVSTTMMEAAMDISSLSPTADASWGTLYRKMSEGRTTPVADANLRVGGMTYNKPTATPPVI